MDKWFNEEELELVRKNRKKTDEEEYDRELSYLIPEERYEELFQEVVLGTINNNSQN